MNHPIPDQSEIANRIVMVGASNLARGFRTLTSLVGSRIEGPVDMRFAMGHGRSYGKWSTILWRSIPGIVDCGLWESIQEWKGHAPPAAVVTDIGNDLMYGRDIDQILGWVESVLKKLQAFNTEIILTTPPTERVMRLGKYWYLVARAILFPGNRIPFEEMKSRTLALADGVRRLHVEYNTHLIDPPNEWYGLDPIHIRRRDMQRAWAQMLKSWTRNVSWKPGPDVTPLPWRKRLPRHRMEHYQVFNRDRHQPQPLAITDRMTVRCY